jgi:hypothetical protein
LSRRKRWRGHISFRRASKIVFPPFGWGENGLLAASRKVIRQNRKPLPTGRESNQSEKICVKNAIHVPFEIDNQTKNGVNKLSRNGMDQSHIIARLVPIRSAST